MIPQPTHGIVEDDGDAHWYIVKHGDTLRGIAAQVLCREEGYDELFQLNVGNARVAEQGPVCVTRNLIWPGLRLRLPTNQPAVVDESPGEPVAADAEPEPEPEPAGPLQPVTVATPTAGADSEADVTVVEPNISDSREAEVSEFVTPMPPLPTVVPTPATWDVAILGRSTRPSPEVAALAAGGVAAAMAAGVMVVRRRRPAPVPDGSETDTKVERGFADADPVGDLARRLAHTVDSASAIASLLGQAYLAVFEERLGLEQRRDATHGVVLAATRHGRTSTTLTLAAPVPARPHLVRYMRTAAERAFGEHVDVDGQISQDGDVLVRATWDKRHPVPERVLELVGADGGPSLPGGASVW